MKRQELPPCKTNVTSSTYYHSGIYSFKIKYKGWKNVLDTLGKLNNKLKEKRKEIAHKYKVIVNSTAVITKDTSHC